MMAPGESTRSRWALPAALAVIVALFAADVALLQARERRYSLAPAPGDEALYVGSGTALRRLSVGYSTLAADLYWIRSIQYFGGTRRRLASEPPATSHAQGASGGYPLLYPLLDATTTLDPRFNIAYRFGSIFLAEPFPGGAGRPDQAIDLLRKGLAARPDKWEYMQDIAFVYYWWLHDYRSAADWFDRASRVPGAPWWLRSLAAVTLAEGGDRQSSRIMWQAIHDSAELDWLRGESERRLLQLQALDNIDALQKGVDGFTAAVGSAPAGWGPMVKSGSIRGIPVDPTGIPYEIDPSGRVRLSPSSPLFPLPSEPKALSATPS
jgi:hypothetical protein